MYVYIYIYLRVQGSGFWVQGWGCGTMIYPNRGEDIAAVLLSNLRVERNRVDSSDQVDHSEWFT